MPSRRLVVLTTAAGLLAAGAPLLTVAHADGLPADYPAAGCFTYADPKGDASYTVEGPIAAPNDPDLDILGVALETTATSLRAYAQIDGLTTDGPSMADGHRYSLKFTFNKHVFSASGSDYASGSGDSGSGQLRDGLAETGQAAHTTQLGVDTPSVVPADANYFNKGFVDSGLKVTFDYTNKWVVWDLPIADIQKYGGAPFAGTITAVSVVSQTDEYAVGSQWDSTVKDNATTATDTWTVGDNACFGPPAAVLTNLGATKAQYGDAATVSAKLTDASGAALAGAPVTFTLGRLLSTVKTNSKGIATTKLSSTSVAGRYTLSESYAGSPTVGAAKLSTLFTIVAERTAIVLGVARSGTKRIVTATLRDDDRHALPGQRITWSVNGETVKRTTTSSRGVTTFTARAGQTVKAAFAGVSGKYVAASASRKV